MEDEIEKAAMEYYRSVGMAPQSNAAGLSTDQIEAASASNLDSLIEQRQRERDMVMGNIGPVQQYSLTGGGDVGGGTNINPLASTGSLPSGSSGQQGGGPIPTPVFSPKEPASQQDVERAIRDAAVLGVPPERLRALFDELEQKRNQGLDVRVRMDPNFFRPAKGAAALDDKREKVLLLETLYKEAKDELDAQDKHLLTAKQIERVRDQTEANQVLDYLNKKYEKKWKPGEVMIMGDQVEIRDAYLQTLIGKLADEFFDQRAKDALTKTLNKSYFKQITFTLDEAYTLMTRGDIDYFQEVGGNPDPRKNGFPFLQFYDYVFSIEELYSRMFGYELQIQRQDRSTDLVQALQKHILPGDNRPWIFHRYFPVDKRMQRAGDGADDKDNKSYDVTVGQAVDSAETFDPSHLLIWNPGFAKDGAANVEQKTFYDKLKSSIASAFPYKRNYSRSSTEYELACREALFMENDIWRHFVALKQGLFKVNFTVAPEFSLPNYYQHRNDLAGLQYVDFIVGNDEAHTRSIQRGNWINTFDGPYGVPSDSDYSCLQPKYTNIRNYPCNIFGRMIAKATSTTPAVAEEYFNFANDDIDASTGEPSAFKLFARARGTGVLGRRENMMQPFTAFKHKSDRLKYIGGGPIGQYNFVLGNTSDLIKHSRHVVESQNAAIADINARATALSMRTRSQNQGAGDVGMQAGYLGVIPQDVYSYDALFDWTGFESKDALVRDKSETDFFVASSGSMATGCAIPIDAIGVVRPDGQVPASYIFQYNSRDANAEASFAYRLKTRPLVNARVIPWNKIASRMDELIRHPIHVCSRLSDAFTRTRTDDLILTAYVKRIQDRFFELSKSINESSAGSLTNMFGSITSTPSDLGKLLWLPKCTSDEIYVFKDKDGNPMPYDKAVHFDAASGTMYMDPAVAMEKTECAPRVLAPYVPGLSTKEHLAALIRSADVTRSDFKDSSLARDLVSYLNQTARVARTEDVSSALRDISRKLDTRSSVADLSSLAMSELVRNGLQPGSQGLMRTNPEVAQALATLATALSGASNKNKPAVQANPLVAPFGAGQPLAAPQAAPAPQAPAVNRARTVSSEMISPDEQDSFLDYGSVDSQPGPFLARVSGNRRSRKQRGGGSGATASYDDDEMLATSGNLPLLPSSGSKSRMSAFKTLY